MSITVYGPSFDAFSDNAYTDKDVARLAVSTTRLVDFKATNIQKIEVYPPSSDITAIEYGVALCKRDDGYWEPKIVVFEYCADQNAVNCSYGSFYTAVDTRAECKLVVYSGTRVVNGREKRFVAILDEERNEYRVYDAPVYIRLKTSDGREVVVPVGFDPVTIGIIIGVIVVAGIAAWGYMTHAQAEEKWANTVQMTVKACLDKGDTRCAVRAVAAASAARDEAESKGDIWSWLKNAAVGIAGVLAMIVMIFKYKLILEAFRDLFGFFRRRRS